ncbi:glycoside hydrolase family 89 protein [Zopfia rhizophila CBS 207.26]|uniref:Glycoside hydrolase family 89 protein n=1 Tax=Zopfia rhizophila CBS 207.26 TaxID=1314779 RepID=A0A6A6DNN8_9PEZI|nr:glycoside hydrolase family 89 protein [Zopfia rhizophila CBS 207.26]
MQVRRILGAFALLWAATALAATSTQGLYDLVKRRVASHCKDFVFILEDTDNSSELTNDEYTISTATDGSIAIQGNSLSALATGLRRYFTDIAHVDIYWFFGSHLDEAASPLPRPNGTITGKSNVPWRYYFNTVTFSYTTSFWSWSDWELELDWLALHSVNLPLAWVGFEKILLDIFRDIGLSDSEIISFFSGPAFQAWNRFGNIQGSWGGELPLTWINDQFELQKKILERMLELGMTPILPAFTGFVPRSLPSLYPNSSFVNGSRWEDFPAEYTNTTFLEPSDSLFEELQERCVRKQIEYYGNITKFYTLDQYNENDPFSGDLEYLRNVTHGTWQSLKSANPAAVWVMQGWLFYSNSDFWNDERVEAYLSGVEEDSDMLILDLFSESQPQWQRTRGYYGKPWIWNQLHDYGGNQGLYGQIENLTVNPTQALQSSSSLVGFGLTPEGQEGNEIMYKLLLDQAWQNEPIDTRAYFRQWVRNRYSTKHKTDVPDALYTAWEILRQTAYNNTNLTSNAVPKSIFELSPNITSLTNRTGHHPTTLNYDPTAILEAWRAMLAASQQDKELWDNPAYQHDFVDLTRQFISNSFLANYVTLMQTWNASSSNSTAEYRELLRFQAGNLIGGLDALDAALSTLPQFRLDTLINAARSLAPLSDTGIADFYEYNARNQISRWGPNGEINDYASKSWGGLVGGYYKPRWEAFLNYLIETGPEEYDSSEARGGVKEVEEMFQVPGSGIGMQGSSGELKQVVERDVLPVLRGLGII